MKNYIRLILLIGIISGYATMTSCQDNKTASNNNGNGKEKVYTRPEDAAKSALAVLNELATNPKTKGATSLSADEVKKLQVGAPIALTQISYEALLRANADSMPSPVTAVMTEQSSWLFPLELNGVAATIATVRGSNNNWALSTAGDNKYVNGFLSNKTEGIIDIIEVPGLGINFLRYKTNEAVFYLADRDLAEAEIAKDRPMTERQALQSLVRYARIFESKYGKDLKNKKLVD